MVRGSRDERGQVLPFVALIIAMAAASLLLLGRVGAAAAMRGQAQTAADAAALAGAAEGEGAARSIARANGGTLLDYGEEGNEAWAEVRVGTATARARAMFEGGDGWGGESSVGLAPGLRAAVARAEQLLGAKVPITSGYRSPAEQAALWRRRASNPYPVARPGSSRHERGLAIDVPSAFVPRLLTVARRAGLCQPYPKADPVHFELCR